MATERNPKDRPEGSVWALVATAARHLLAVGVCLVLLALVAALGGQP